MFLWLPLFLKRLTVRLGLYYTAVAMVVAMSETHTTVETPITEAVEVEEAEGMGAAMTAEGTGEREREIRRRGQGKRRGQGMEWMPQGGMGAVKKHCTALQYAVHERMRDLVFIVGCTCVAQGIGDQAGEARGHQAQQGDSLGISYIGPNDACGGNASKC